MTGKLIRLTTLALFVASCRNAQPTDGRLIEAQILSANNLNKDYATPTFLQGIVDDVNCADSVLLRKKLVLADHFNSSDTNEILLIPYVPNANSYKSSAYSDINNRFVLMNPTYIREFTLKNTLSSDTSSFKPVLELMLLHEMGHFILKKEGAFDLLLGSSHTSTGQQTYNTQPEFLTSVKKVELSADSLAIEMVKKKLNDVSSNCLGIAFDVELIIPGMQFQLSGRRMIDRFGSNDVGFLHDPSNDHPNLELRISFMNYFLFPTDSLRQMIDDYLYNRTVVPVHRQESDPRLFQAQEKKLPGE